MSERKMKICEVVQMINSISSAFKIFLTFNVYYFENFFDIMFKS